MARLVSYGHAGIDPKIMGIGPVSAVKHALEQGRPQDRATSTSSSRTRRSPRRRWACRRSSASIAKKVNPNGGAVALGHPIGATGGILTVKAMYELQRTGGRYGLVTMCIGGGQGIAAVIERL